MIEPAQQTVVNIPYQVVINVALSEGVSFLLPADRLPPPGRLILWVILHLKFKPAAPWRSDHVVH